MGNLNEKNPKVLAFYIVAIIIIVAVAILALTVSGNSGAFYLCLGIIAGVVAIILSKLIMSRKSKKKIKGVLKMPFIELKTSVSISKEKRS